MKKIMLLMFLCFLFSCNTEKKDNKTTTPAPKDPGVEVIIPPRPPVDENAPLSVPVVSLEVESLTNKDKIEGQLVSNEIGFSVDIFSDEFCQNKIAEVFFDSLIKSVELSLVSDVENNFYIEINKEGIEDPGCVIKNSTLSDKTSPQAPTPSFLMMQSNSYTTTQIFTGGDAADFSEEVSVVRYYYLREITSQEPLLVKEVSIDQYLTKQVLINIPEGEVSYFKISALDLAGNESVVSSGTGIFNHISQSLSAPVISYDIVSMEGKSVNYNNFLIKGMASVHSTKISIYRGPGRVNFVKEVSSDSFNLNGVNVPLLANQNNDLYLYAENADKISVATRFSIFHDNVAPNKPEFTMDSINDSVYELSESTAEISGYVSSDTIEVRVYMDSALLNVHSIFETSGTMFLINPRFEHYGYNTFYVVAIDRAGNRSQASSITLLYLDYDEEE